MPDRAARRPPHCSPDHSPSPPAGRADPAAAPHPATPTEISVSLFGTFGYDEVGLFEEYEAANPGITITYESTQDEDKYWPALQTRLTSGQRRRRHPGHRGRPHRRRRARTRPTSGWTCTTPRRPTPIGRYSSGRSRPPPRRTARCSASAPTSARWASATAPTCSSRPACRPTPTQLAAQMLDWDDYVALGKEYKATAPDGTAWPDSAGGLYNAIISTEQEIYYDESGELVYDDQPGREAGVRPRRRGRAERADRQARAVLDPEWDQGFVSGSFATIACPSWMIGYIKGKAGDAGAGKWNVTTLPGGAGGNWGGAYLAIPAASEHQEEAAEADRLADRARAAGEGLREGRQLPVDHRTPSPRSPTPRTRTSTAPRSARSSPTSAQAAPDADPRPERRRDQERDHPGPARRRDQRRQPADAWAAPASKIDNQVG